VADKSHPLVTQQIRKWTDLRLTWQASPRNKFSFFADHQSGLQPTFDPHALLAPEATAYFDNETSYTSFSRPIARRG